MNEHLRRYAARTVFMVVAFSAAVFAHHSNTPFDMSRTLHATGVVQSANFKNPHSQLTLLIDNENGSEAVSFEGHSLATLRHYGLLPSMVKAGNTVTISYAPRHDGEPGGIFLSIVTQGGEMLDFSHLGYD
jgi:hypothetical protein